MPVTPYSLGYGLLFYLASFVVTPVLFSKILPFFLMAVTVWILYEFGQTVRDRPTGVVLALGFLFLNLASSSAISVANGLQRSFAMTFVILLIYCLQRRRFVVATLVTVASALIYAPAFALMAAIWGIFGLGLGWRQRPQGAISQGGFGYLFVALLLGVMILSPILFPTFRALIGTESGVDDDPQAQASAVSPESYRHLWDNPTYQIGGEFPLFIMFPLVGRGGLVDLGEDLINLTILAVIGLLILSVRGRKALALPYVVWCLLVATLSMFVMSWLAIWLTNAFLLYLPSRYSRVGLFLFLLMFVCLNMVDSMKEVPQLIQRNPRRLIWLLVGIELLVVVLIIFYPVRHASIAGFNMKWLLALAGVAFGLLGAAILRQPERSIPDMSAISRTLAGRILIGTVVVVALSGWAIYAPLLTEVSYLDPPPAERELLSFLETLPKDAVIAGTPCALDNVQLFAKRRALFSCEQPATDEVVVEAFGAYYADNPRTVADFCSAHSVDFLVVDDETYTRDYLAQGWIFYEPLNQVILPYIVNQQTFLLAEVPADIKLFEAENYSVIRCDDLAKMAHGYGNGLEP
jgi:hypothetical protein